jgi:chemotaxis signal transduction protein
MPAKTQTAELPQSICTFWLGDHWFGVDARLVRRVTTTPARTPIPLAPTVVWGYVNLRGQIHLALDLGVRFAISNRACQQEALLVLRPAVADRLAIVADRIGRIVSLGAGEFDTAIANSLALKEQIRRDGLALGVVKLDEGLLTILDPTQLPRLLDGAPSIAERPLPTNSL